jgi:hypothetical protein
MAAGLCRVQAGDDSKPAGTNIPGAKYPRVYPDLRVAFRVNAPSARRVQVQPGGDDNGLGKGPKDSIVTADNRLPYRSGTALPEK